MSDDHEQLAKQQEQEAADLEERSEVLQGHIDDAKDEAGGLEQSETIATPDADVDPKG